MTYLIVIRVSGPLRLSLSLYTYMYLYLHASLPLLDVTASSVTETGPRFLPGLQNFAARTGLPGWTITEQRIAVSFFLPDPERYGFYPTFPYKVKPLWDILNQFSTSKKMMPVIFSLFLWKPSTRNSFIWCPEFLFFFFFFFTQNVIVVLLPW